MKKKYMIAVTVILIVSLMAPPCAFAADAQIQSSSQIAVTRVQLSWSKTTQYRMGLFYEITACEDMEIIGASKVEFYYFFHNEWVLESTISVEDYPVMETNGTSYWSILVERNAKYSNVPYRAVVYFYCKGPYGISTLKHYSNVITSAINQVIEP